MEDNSFLYFTQDEVLSKIDIDPRLIDSFKRVMAKMQGYYNANGYTSQRNFKEYFEKYLLNSGENNLRFYVNKIEKPGVGGFYCKGRHEICINENNFQMSSDRLDSVLCHEFTHFIVMHSLMRGQADPQIINGGFINESLTEMMTQQMYPNSNAYEAQVTMQKYANLLSNQVNNYSKFLQGHVDARWSSSEWNNFEAAANRFQKDFDEKGYITLAEARNNVNFVDAQRRLINLFIRPTSEKTFEQYCEDISKLIDRPVPDQEFVNSVVSNMDKTMIKSLRINSPSINEFLEKKLARVRDLVKDSKKYNGKNVYEFEFAGRTFTLDENLNLEGSLVGMQKGWSPQTRIMTLQSNGEKLQINVDEIDFKSREKEIQSELEELSSYYSKDSTRNLSMIDKAIEQSGELSKIEKFTLPMVGIDGKKTPYTIYVATYGDKMVVLNNYEQLNNMSNVQLNRFIGMTHSDPSKAAIYSEKIGVIENGMVFTTLNEKQISNRAILEYSKQLGKNISLEELSKAIEKYKSGDFYSESDTEEIIKSEALKLLAEEKFASLTDEQKQKYIELAKENSDRFIVTMKDGKVEVAAIHGSQIINAFNGKRQVLYDSKGKGSYNELYEELRKSKGETKLDDRPSIQVDKDGNILVEKKEKDVEVKLTNEEKLAQATQELESLRQQYGVVATQMEELMKRNAETPIPNYQEQLNKLMAQRDSISEKMRTPMWQQKTYQQIIDEEKQTQHKAVIFQVERLLGTHITPTAGFVYDNELNMPRQTLKDTSALRQEQGAIFKQLEQLYYDGELDLKTYNNMKMEILKEFDGMVAKAPKPVQPPVRDNSEYTQQQEQNPTPVQHPYINQDVREQVEESELRKKYGYDEMSPEEKERFDSNIKRKFTKQPEKKKEQEPTDKTKLEEQRRELRRKQFEERARAMGLNLEQIANLDSIFMQQEMIEQQALEESEEIEHSHGMFM